MNTTVWFVVILLLGSVIAIDHQLCLFYNDHFDTIHTEIRECNTTGIIILILLIKNDY